MTTLHQADFEEAALGWQTATAPAAPNLEEPPDDPGSSLVTEGDTLL